MKTFFRKLVARAFGSSADAWLRGTTDSGHGGAELGDIYGQSEIVYACVQALAENISFLPFCISATPGQGSSRMRRRDATCVVLESGPLVDLFDQPHPQLSRYDFWELIIAWLHIRGSAFVIATDASGNVMRIHGRLRGDPVPQRLIILQANYVVRILAGNELAGWHYFAPPGSPRVATNLLPEEVLHIRLPGLGNYIDGLAPAMVAQLAAQGDYAAAAFMRGLMANNADTGLIVSSDQWLTDEQRNQITAALRERKRKAGTADRPLLLGGGLRVEKPTVSTVDLQYLASRQFNRQQICAIFRVPEFLLGFTADANRSIGVEQRQSFVQSRICPLAARLASSIQPIVRMFDPSASCWFDTDCHPAMVEARRLRFTTARQAFEIGVPLNDLNEVFDLGLDEYPWGDTAYIPFGLQAVGIEPAEPVQDVPQDKSGGGHRAAPVADTRPPSDNPFLAIAATLRGRGHTCAAHEAWLASVAGSVRKKKAICRSYFFAQRARVLRALEDRFGKSAGPDITRAIDDLWDASEEDAKLAAALKPALIRDLDFGGAQVWQELGMPGDFAVPPDEAIAFLGKRTQSIKGINEATRTGLRDSLGEGLAQGDTYQQLVDRVKSVYADATQSRAETIATTETNVAINSGRFEGMQSAGVEKKAWLASNLSGSRPEHQQAGRDYADGIPLANPFRVGGEYLDHPGDPMGSPGNTINCRCTVLAMLGDKAVRPSRYLSYEEWLPTADFAPGRAGASGGSTDTTKTTKTVLQDSSGVLQSGLAPTHQPV